jgi:hypothetical protein
MSDCLFPRVLDGVGGVWAGYSARPGLTEQKKAGGSGIFPRGGDPPETRPFPAGKGITERGLRLDKLHPTFSGYRNTAVLGIYGSSYSGLDASRGGQTRTPRFSIASLGGLAR